MTSDATKQYKSPCCYDDGYVVITETTRIYDNICRKNGGYFLKATQPKAKITACYCLKCRENFLIYTFSTDKECYKCNSDICSLVDDIRKYNT